MATLVQRVQGSRPVRAFQHYGQAKGPVFAQGMTLSAFYSLFAALLIGFSVFTAVLGDNLALRDRVVEAVAQAVPGLIGTDGSGVIDVDALVTSSFSAWAGSIGAVGIIVTMIGWIGTSREGFRAVFGLPNAQANPVLLKLGDLGVAAGIGALVLVSAGVLVVTSVLEDVLGLGGAGVVLGIFVQVALDVAVVALLYRFAGRLRLPPKQLLGAALACAVVFFVLKQFAALLLGGGSNPLLAGFAAILGLLIWLGLVNQTLLFALAWVSVGTVGVAYARLEDVEIARAEAIRRARADRERLRTELADRDRPNPQQSRLVRSMHKRLAKRR